MKRMKPWPIIIAQLAAVSTAVFVATNAPAQTSAWFGGGSYDGHDGRNVQQAVGIPYANNADGATNVLPTSAWLNGMLGSTGTAATAVSVYWGASDGTTNKTDWANTNHFGVQQDGALLTTNVTGLMPETTYYYRFYATNTAAEESWALASTNFSTPELPVVTNTGASAVDAFSAVLNGNLTAGIRATIVVYWGVNSNAWSVTNNLGARAEGPFTNAVSGLTPATTYYSRCFASNAVGTNWSETVSFTTLGVVLPSITNTGASALDTYAAVLNGSLTAGVGATIVVYCGTNSSAWSLTNNLGTRAEGTFSTAVSGLNAATVYSYRCFASNSAGIAWSEITPFTTRLAPTRFWGGSYDGFDALPLTLPIWIPDRGTIITIW